MRDVLSLVEQIGPLNDNVLILGESGTGKELIAKALHGLSGRNGILEPFNCATLYESTADTVLFGYRARSALAVSDPKGYKGEFERAKDGTLFLDEIGSLPSNVHEKLLRVLEQKEFIPHGGEKVTVNVRVIAATDKDLDEALKKKTFSNPLYQRLSQFVIKLPPLRERISDVKPLAQDLVQEYARAFGKTINTFHTQAIDLMLGYHWPGNVRELQNAIRRAVAQCTGSTITASDLPPEIRGGPPEDAHNIILIDDNQSNLASFARAAEKFEFAKKSRKAMGLTEQSPVGVFAFHPDDIGRNVAGLERVLRGAVVVALDINFESGDRVWGWENGVHVAAYILRHLKHLSSSLIWITRTPNYQTFYDAAFERMSRVLPKEEIDQLKDQFPSENRTIQVIGGAFPSPDADVQWWGKVLEMISKIAAQSINSGQPSPPKSVGFRQDAAVLEPPKPSTPNRLAKLPDAAAATDASPPARSGETSTPTLSEAAQARANITSVSEIPAIPSQPMPPLAKRLVDSVMAWWPKKEGQACEYDLADFDSSWKYAWSDLTEPEQQQCRTAHAAAAIAAGLKNRLLDLQKVGKLGAFAARNYAKTDKKRPKAQYGPATEATVYKIIDDKVKKLTAQKRAASFQRESNAQQKDENAE
jgi:hypothetical protein